MNTWHPLPPPAMIPVMLINTQLFSAGLVAGVCLALGVWLTYHVAMPLLLRVWKQGKPGAAFICLVCLLACPLPAHAASFLVGSSYAPYPSPFASWRITTLDGTFSCTSSSPAGWSIVSGVGTPQGGTPYSVYAPTTTVKNTYQITAGSYQTSFEITPPPPPPPVVTSAPCTSGYPSSVAPLLGSAPSPCAYFDASQGFNKSSAPLITAVLAVLALILAIWLGHDTVMSIFRRLLSGATGGN